MPMLVYDESAERSTDQTEPPSSHPAEPSSSPSGPSSLPTFAPPLGDPNPSLGSRVSSFVPDTSLEDGPSPKAQARCEWMQRICRNYEMTPSASRWTKREMRRLAAKESYLLINPRAKPPTFERYTGLMTDMSKLNPIPQATITELGNFVASMSFSEVLSGMKHKSSVSRDMKNIVISEETKKNRGLDIRLKDYRMVYLEELCGCIYKTATWCLDVQSTEGQIAEGQNAESQTVASLKELREDAITLYHLHKDLERIITFRRTYPIDTSTDQPSHAARTTWDEEATQRREDLSRRLRLPQSGASHDTRATLSNLMRSVRETFQGHTTQASVT